jgi:hypothetical protein
VMLRMGRSGSTVPGTCSSSSSSNSSHHPSIRLARLTHH